jgi:hypothetical protein
MARGRLTVPKLLKAPALPTKKEMEELLKKSRTAWPLALVLGIAGLFIIILWWLTPYYDDIYHVLPGFYQNAEYEELSVRKNELMDQSKDTLDEINELGTELAAVEVSSEGYGRMVELNSEIISLQEFAWETINEILEIDDELLGMRLPENVAQYVRLGHEYDLTRKDQIALSLEISNARRDAAELSVMRTTFDSCLAGIDWAGADKTIADGVSACAALISPMEQKVASMEDRYEVELEGLSAYLPLLREQWEANAAYYEAISQGDYTTANEHDKVFVERKRQISEIAVEEAFDEFYVEAIGPMSEEFVILVEEEAQDAERMNIWYEQNIIR